MGHCIFEEMGSERQRQRGNGNFPPQGFGAGGIHPKRHSLVSGITERGCIFFDQIIKPIFMDLLHLKRIKEEGNALVLFLDSGIGEGNDCIWLIFAAPPLKRPEQNKFPMELADLSQRENEVVGFLKSRIKCRKRRPAGTTGHSGGWPCFLCLYILVWAHTESKVKSVLWISRISRK